MVVVFPTICWAISINDPSKSTEIIYRPDVYIMLVLSVVKKMTTLLSVSILWPTSNPNTANV